MYLWISFSRSLFHFCRTLPYYPSSLWLLNSLLRSEFFAQICGFDLRPLFNSIDCVFDAVQPHDAGSSPLFRPFRGFCECLTLRRSALAGY